MGGPQSRQSQPLRLPQLQTGLRQIHGLYGDIRTSGCWRGTYSQKNVAQSNPLFASEAGGSPSPRSPGSPEVLASTSSARSPYRSNSASSLVCSDLAMK